ncbi:MAG: hypothetical protein ACI9OS_002241 [Ulvibacter sp.]|jgi:hypothetical protein
MKNINKISIFLFLILGITFTSCETTDLDLLDDPNNVTLDKADLERYMVAIQLDFRNFVETMGRNGAQLTRIEYMFGRTYLANYTPENTNFEWGLAYQGMFSDIVGAELLATEAGANKHLALMNIMKAYTLMTLVDFYGDVPFSEASNPSEFPFPSTDDGATVYAGAIALLDEATVLLGQGGPNLGNDFFYDNDFGKWQKLLNTLKMNAYLNTRLVDSGALGKFNAIVTSGAFISNSADDFQFTYGTSESNPNTRHPAYGADYGVSGAGRYRSNWLMELMLNDNDPRIRYYFFRQSICTPGTIGGDGVACPGNGPQLQCSLQAKPPHFPSTMTYCNVDGGYWGRDHGNDEGIPPDSFRRTAMGVYPAGGRFDGDEFANTGLGLGAGGAGVTPIMLASWVDLMRAEAAMVSNNTSDAGTFLQSALTKAVAKVLSFGSLDPTANTALFASTADVNAHKAAVSAAFNSGNTNDKWNLLANQTFVGYYGNGINPYNFYRRTGFPTTLQFNIEPSSGNFVRSFLYPADEANTNSNITQKANVDVQVFWDNNPSSPGFPFSN